MALPDALVGILFTGGGLLGLLCLVVILARIIRKALGFQVILSVILGAPAVWGILAFICFNISCLLAYLLVFSGPLWLLLFTACQNYHKQQQARRDRIEGIRRKGEQARKDIDRTSEEFLRDVQSRRRSKNG